jgi:phospholipid/cholesterol/gamma-HCH transport system permease protein
VTFLWGSSEPQPPARRQMHGDAFPPARSTSRWRGRSELRGATRAPTDAVRRAGGRTAISLGRTSARAVAFVGEVASAFGRLLRGRARFRFRDVVLLVEECGAQALPIVTLISLLVGMILAFVGAIQLTRFGAEIYVADLVAVATVREMGCIMTGIIMAGRTGSGFAARLGTMNVTQETDALATLGIRPIEFLVLPRVVALCLMMPVLCAYADVLGIAGGAAVSALILDVTPLQYFRETVSAITLASYAAGIVKSVAFGAIVAVSGCLRGMESGRSSAAVGEAATSAVVTGIVLIIAADGVFAVLFDILGI